MTLRLLPTAATLWLALASAGPARSQATDAAPSAADASAAAGAIEDAAVSPDGARLALILRGPHAAVVRVLSAQGDREIGAGELDIRGVGWLDPTHLEVTNSTIAEAPPVLPRQRVNQGVSFDLDTGKSVTLLDRTDGVAPMLVGARQVEGVYKGRPVVFMRGLSAGPAFALYRVDIATGRGFAITRPEFDAEDWIVTADGDVRARRTSRSDGRGFLTEVRTTHGWRTLEDDGTLKLAGLTRDGARVVVWRDDQPFVASAEDGALTPLPAPAGRTVETLILGDDARVRGLRLAGMTPDYVFDDPALSAVWPKVRTAFPGLQVSYLGASRDARSIALDVQGPSDAGALYWFDMATHRAEKIGDLRPGIPAAWIGTTSEVDLRARDGLTLPSALTLPAGREAKALPLILLVGAWPTSSANLAFSQEAQRFAHQGYAVLRVNTRGSALTPQLMAAGVGQLGAAMQTDLDDAVADLAGRGVIDPKRVCIVGGGYGGYAALEAVTVDQGPYRCAVAVSPQVDLGEATQWQDALTRGGEGRIAVWRRMAGADLPGAGRRMAAASPLRAAGRAAAPVLIIADPRDLGESSGRARRMAAALKAAGKTYELVQLDQETSDLATGKGAGAAMTAMLDFVRRKNPA